MRTLVITIQSFILLVAACSVSLTASAAPNCPPQYQEICKQLIKILDANNDGQHFYSWDGTKLTITNGNLVFYDTINHSPTDTRAGNYVEAYRDEWFLMSGMKSKDDFFPHLLSQITTAAQGGQRVYLHLSFGSGNYTNVGLSNTPMAVPTAIPTPVPSPIPQQPGAIPGPAPSVIPNMVPQPMAVPTAIPTPVPSPIPQQPGAIPSPAPSAIPNMVPQPMAVPTAIPTPVPSPIPQQPGAVPGPAPSAIPNQPQTISVTHNVRNANGLVVDKTTVNAHFVTDTAGNHLDQESRAYLFDNNNDVWSCMVAGLGTRKTAGANGEIATAGHAETLEFRSSHIAHIPANHPMHPGCLISVQQ